MDGAGLPLTAACSHKRSTSAAVIIFVNCSARPADEHKWGEKYDEAIAIGFEYQTAANAAHVAEKFHFYRRREKLSWSHHAEVAPLDANVADEFLDRRISALQFYSSHRWEVYYMDLAPFPAPCRFRRCDSAPAMRRRTSMLPNPGHRAGSHPPRFHEGLNLSAFQGLFILVFALGGECELTRPPLGAQRRIEARIGQLLGKAEWGGDRKSDQVLRGGLDPVPKNSRSDYRLLARALGGECDLTRANIAADFSVSALLFPPVERAC
jgi:hypothetical protein